MGRYLDTERYTESDEIVYGISGFIRAFDNELLRWVAIKVLDPQLALDEAQIGRFEDEARITAQLEHPNIVPIYDLGKDRKGRSFVAMKLISGQTLDDILRRLGDSRLEAAHLKRLLQVFAKVCDAASFAHSRFVLHRDLKPSNVMIGDFGQVFVLDWGIARVRSRRDGPEGPVIRLRAGHDNAEDSELDPPGSLVGTPCYMAPEQLHGLHERLDQRTDVFSLGATLYQILTGEPPLTPEIVRAIWTRKTPPAILPPDCVVSGSRVPPELSRIALRALAYDPADRYSSVVDVNRDLDSFRDGA